MSKRKINRKLVLVVDAVLLIIVIFSYRFIYLDKKNKVTYEEESVKSVNENHNPIFKIKQIIIYNSAYAEDNSDGELKDINISQFSDIAIYIDNQLREDKITPENTISELYVDNIVVETNDKSKGELNFNYKNIKMMGKYVDLNNWSNDGIVYNVLKTNEKNREADYNDPVFYTDCSNPISFGFVNKNLLTHCEVSNATGMLAFDGSILGNTNIPLEDLYTTYSFSIHIVNNYGDEYICNVKLDNGLLDENAPEIYSGYLMKVINLKDGENDFVRAGKRK